MYYTMVIFYCSKILGVKIEADYDYRLVSTYFARNTELYRNLSEGTIGYGLVVFSLRIRLFFYWQWNLGLVFPRNNYCGDCFDYSGYSCSNLLLILH